MASKITSLNVKEELQGQARVVRTGYAARDVADVSGLTAVAKALSSVQPSLLRYAEKSMEERREKDVAEGQLAYEMQANRESWADFVKKNPKYAKSNPWIKEGYLRARMANEGENYRGWIQNRASGPDAVVDVDGQKIPLSEANPEQTAKWFQQQKQAFVQEVMGGETDPALFSEIFVPMASGAERELMSTIMAHQKDVMWNKAITEHTKLITNSLKSSVESGVLDGPDAEEAYKSLGAKFSDVMRQLIMDGVPPQQVNAAVVDAVIAFAEDNDIEDGDEILDIFKYIETSKGSFLGDIPEISKIIQSKKDEIIQDNYWKIKQKEDLEQMAKKKEQDAAEKQIALTFLQNPLALPKQLQAEYLHKYGTDALTSLMSVLRRIHDYDMEDQKGTGSGGSSSNYTRGDLSLVARAEMGDNTITLAEIDSSGLTNSQKVALVKKVISNNEDGVSKHVADKMSKEATELVFSKLFMSKDPLDVDDAERAFGYDVLQQVYRETARRSKEQGVDKKDTVAMQRVLVGATADVIKEFEGFKDVYAAKYEEDSSVSLDNIKQEVKQQEAMSKKHIELATAYGKVLASGGDVTQTDWYKLIATVNKKKGTDLNPYDEAKRLGITLPKGVQKPKKSLFDTTPVKGKAKAMIGERQRKVGKNR